jgi:hypothetical protein
VSKICKPPEFILQFTGIVVKKTIHIHILHNHNIWCMLSHALQPCCMWH